LQVLGGLKWVLFRLKRFLLEALFMNHRNDCKKIKQIGNHSKIVIENSLFASMTLVTHSAQEPGSLFWCHAM